MYWADRIADEIVKSGKYKPYCVDDMKTPSGFSHVGSLMGPVIHSLIFRALKDRGVKTNFTFVINDFDPADDLLPELRGKFEKYLGMPLKLAPSPDPKFKNMADLFGNDFVNSIRSLGVEAKILSSWEMYHQGKFDEVIRIALDNAEKIQAIYLKVSGSKKKETGWLPFQVICEKCKKLGTTKVFAWDGGKVSYKCEPELVKWAKGCGHEGKISPFGGTGKLPWKVDWAAHWKVMGVTVEGAGKDHASAGGSYDIAMAICKEVFKYSQPYKLPYEFILIGGRKMSSSKGLGLKAHDLVKILPPSVGRFLFARADIKSQSNFDPYGSMAIPDLFDDYDEDWRAYNSGGDEKLARTFILSQVNKIPKKEAGLFIPRFRDVANYTQLPNIKLEERFIQMKGSKLTELERDILYERVTYANIWLSKYAPEEYKYQISTKSFDELSLADEQWKFLNNLAEIWEAVKNPEKLQGEIFKLIKNMKINMNEAFTALYMTVLDKSFGPRAGWLLKKFPKKTIIERLTLNKTSKVSKKTSKVRTFDKPDFFVIDSKVREKYPSVSVGIALIKDVNIEKASKELEKEKKEFLNSLSGLTTEKLGEYPEIISYRKLYKEMGIDWHSRRPSPEALLRRVSLGKGLYTINTCVDAYNLVVMKGRISVGAFNADKIKFPTVLRFAGEGDEILLLGDDKPTKYTAKELAYYDKDGGYNIDFNYRDAQRTMVTEKTKKLWINTEGIFDITPYQVEESLNESVEKILKYCGGRLEFSGMVF